MSSSSRSSSLTTPILEKNLSPDRPAYILTLPPEIMAMIGQAVLDTTEVVRKKDDQAAPSEDRLQSFGCRALARFGVTCRYIKDCTTHVLWKTVTVKKEHQISDHCRVHVKCISLADERSCVSPKGVAQYYSSMGINVVSARQWIRKHGQPMVLDHRILLDMWLPHPGELDTLMQTIRMAAGKFDTFSSVDGHYEKVPIMAVRLHTWSDRWHANQFASLRAAISELTAEGPEIAEVNVRDRGQWDLNARFSIDETPESQQQRLLQLMALVPPGKPLCLAVRGSGRDMMKLVRNVVTAQAPCNSRRDCLTVVLWATSLHDPQPDQACLETVRDAMKTASVEKVVVKINLVARVICEGTFEYTWYKNFAVADPSPFQYWPVTPKSSEFSTWPIGANLLPSHLRDEQSVTDSHEFLDCDYAEMDDEDLDEDDVGDLV